MVRLGDIGLLFGRIPTKMENQLDENLKATWKLLCISVVGSPDSPSRHALERVFKVMHAVCMLLSLRSWPQSLGSESLHGIGCFVV